MPVRIVAWKEPTWFVPNADRALWHLLTRAYCVDLEMVDPGKPPKFQEDETVVLFDEQGKTSLHDYDHPENAVYVFGRTHQNNLLEMDHDDSVVIEYPGKSMLFGVTACAIALDDRYRKLNGRND